MKMTAFWKFLHCDFTTKKKSIVGKITQALHFIEMYGHVGER